jgi:hypothetical protein
MEHYLAERYLSAGDGSSLVGDAERARAAASKLSRARARIRFVQTLYVPGDEVCFYLFESDRPDLVARASELAELGIERVLPAVAVLGDGAESDHRRKSTGTCHVKPPFTG